MRREPSPATLADGASAPVDEVLALRGPGEGGARRAAIYLTGFGGHEQQLLLHLGRSSQRWELLVVTERHDFTEQLRQELPGNVAIVAEHTLRAHPPLRSIGVGYSMLQALKVARALGRLDLVASGDIGNFHLVTAALALRRALPAMYVPMAPPTETVATRIARRAVARLITISTAELRKFHPPADALLRNIAPGHLRKLPVTASAGGAFEIFWIGRLDEPQKRPSRAVEILRMLRDRAPAARVRLNVVGDGPAREATRALALTLGVDADIRFWGWLNFSRPLPPDLPPIHALLNTSDYEGVPLTMLDALELGVPCLFRRGVVGDECYRGRLREWAESSDAVAILESIMAARAGGV